GRTRALNDLVLLMGKKGVTPPFTIAEMQLEVADRLSHVSESAVDAEFVSLMAAEHQQVVSSFRLAAETAEDPEVRSYARSVLPLLQADLQKALDLQKELAPPKPTAFSFSRYKL